MEQTIKKQLGSYGSTYNTMKRVYDEVNSADINAYMVGGISSAIQANIDLYRQNTDIDLMVEKKDLDKLMECLKKLGYKIDDKRANLTENYVDANGVFHPMDHELNANIDDGNMLGVGIFVFERKDGTVITNSYAYDEKEGCVIGTQKVMPEELFDLMYSSDKIEYKGTQVKCQSKEYTYLSKSNGAREKDKMDASVIEKYIGEDEQKRINRIKRLQKRIEQYRIMYDKDGNVISSEKLPSIEDKIAMFISGIASNNEEMSNEEIKELVLNTELVKRMIGQDEDIRKIMELWQGTQAEGDIAESARRIAHDYYYSDEPTQQTCVDAQKVGKGTVKEAEQVSEIDETMKTLDTHLKHREKEEYDFQSLKSKIEKSLTGNNVAEAINENMEDLLTLIPEIKDMIGFEHKHPHHHLDVWQHTLEVLRNLNTKDLELNMAALLHDIGKPFSYQDDEVRHFHGHPEVSCEMAKIILTRLGYDEEFIKRVSYLVETHDTIIEPNNLDNKFEMIQKRLQLQYADAKAHHPDKIEKRIRFLDGIKNQLKVLER